MDVSAWLRQHGLDQYEQAFRDNGVDAEVLPNLTAEDLKEIGVTAVGHRRKLLDAIAKLNQSAETSPPGGQSEPQSGSIPTDAASRVGPSTAERRHLTVMFCDLVGSTELSGGLDPEDYRELLRLYHQACSKPISLLDGFVAKYMGDGVLAYFGYPYAHEDEAARAARAALALVAEVGQLTLPGLSRPLQVRVGIATGLVVVGDMIGAGSAQEQSIAGETPNLAARLQAVAPPNGVIIAEATRRLLGSAFELEDLGPQVLKGFADPVPTWRVIAQAAVQSRFEARGGGFTPLVGRKEEVELLSRRWEQACEGEGQAILLSGEAGIGKSRVAHAFIELIRCGPGQLVQLQCSPYFSNSALHPIAEQIERAAGFDPHDTAAERLDKLERLLAPGQVDLTVPFLAVLLSLPTSDRYPVPTYDPRRQNELTIEAAVEYLVGLARERPALVLIEDIHWADPSTLDMLDRLVDQIATRQVLVLVTTRPGLILEWQGRPNATLISLNRLARRQALELVQFLASDGTLPADIVDQIVSRADGIPLYVEELTKAVLEARATPEKAIPQGGSNAISVPATLHDSLMARLDRHPTARVIAQAGAVIGREFSHELLSRIAPQPELDLDAALQQLVSSELVFVRGSPPEATYTFKHALVRDAAYDSLLKSRRQDLHARVANILEADYRDVVDRQPELLAYHFSLAQLPEQALTYWERAANDAAARQAHQEAMRHCESGLEAAQGLTDAQQRNRFELKLQVRLGNSAIAAKGWSAPEVGQAFYRARTLCIELDDSELIHPVLVGLFYFHSFQAKLHPAEALGLELLALGEEKKDRVLQVGGHKVLVDIRYKLAKFEEARHHLQTGMSLYEASPWPEISSEFLDDPGPNLLIYGSVVLWVLGFPESAKQAAEDAVALAWRGGHRLSIAHTVYMAGHLAELSGSWEEVQRSNDETAALAEEWGLMGLRQQVARRDRLVAVALRSDPEQIEYKRKNPQPGFARSLHEAVVAQALGRLGRPDEGIQIIEAAVRWSEETSSLFFHAELHRIWAALLKQQGDSAGAERLLDAALTVAKRQRARMWELRAACDLSQLWNEQSRRAEAHALLAPVLGEFTEGSETQDLVSARNLLQAIAPIPPWPDSKVLR